MVAQGGVAVYYEAVNPVIVAQVGSVLMKGGSGGSEWLGLTLGASMCFSERLVARKVDDRLPRKGNSNSHGARPVR